MGLTYFSYEVVLDANKLHVPFCVCVCVYDIIWHIQCSCSVGLALLSRQKVLIAWYASSSIVVVG